MIAYYKKSSFFCGLGGAAVGVLLVILGYRGQIVGTGSPWPIYAVVLGAVLGWALGKSFSVSLASRRLRELEAVLYQEANPAAFLQTFVPLHSTLKNETAEYMDGCCKISFALEAEGKLEEALAQVEELKPLSLKEHALSTTALVCNQRCNVYLLQHNIPATREMLEVMTDLAARSEKRAPALCRNLKDCVRLHEARIACLEGRMDADTAYIEEEAQLSTNAIHRKEMQLSLAEYYLRTDRPERARTYLDAVLADRFGIYPEKAAEALLTSPETVWRMPEDTAEPEAEMTENPAAEPAADAAENPDA